MKSNYGLFFFLQLSSIVPHLLFTFFLLLNAIGNVKNKFWRWESWSGKNNRKKWYRKIEANWLSRVAPEKHKQLDFSVAIFSVTQIDKNKKNSLFCRGFWVRDIVAVSVWHLPIEFRIFITLSYSFSKHSWRVCGIFTQPQTETSPTPPSRFELRKNKIDFQVKKIKRTRE